MRLSGSNSSSQARHRCLYPPCKPLLLLKSQRRSIQCVWDFKYHTLTFTMHSPAWVLPTWYSQALCSIAKGNCPKSEVWTAASQGPATPLPLSSLCHGVSQSAGWVGFNRISMARFFPGNRYMKGQVGQPGPDTIFLSQHPSVKPSQSEGQGKRSHSGLCCVASFVLTWEERGTQDSGKLAGFLLPVRKLQAISWGEESYFE